jgi:hypothetical protein
MRFLRHGARSAQGRRGDHVDEADGPSVRRDARWLSRRAALLLGTASAGALAGAALVPGEAPTAAAGPNQPPAAAPARTPGGLGLVSIEDFRPSGGSDDDALAEALRHAAAQTYKPAIVVPNGSYTLTRPIKPYAGLHLMAFPFGDEFLTSQQITLPPGGLVAYERGVGSITLENLSCKVTDHVLEPIPLDNSRGAWTDVRILGGGYNSGSTLIEGSCLRLDFQPAYVQAVTDSAVRIGGSDCWLFTRGAHFVSGQLDADQPFLDLHSLGQSVVGSAYITAQGGYGVQISGSGTGLRLAGTLVDASNRNGAQATQLAGVQITGGTDITIDDLWVFNANVSGQSRGLVTVTGGSEIVFNAPRFPGSNAGTTAADTTGACIHTTVPITVIAPKAAGRSKLITAAAPDLVTLVGAPGWQVQTA